MYIKVLFNIKDIKKSRGGGGVRAIFEPKTLSIYLKKKKKREKKKIDQDGIRTHDPGLAITIHV